MAMIDDLELLTNSDNTTLLNLLISQCKEFAVNYCNIEDYTTDLDSTVVLMVCERFNKLSAEGISSRNYSSISEGYLDDFSPSVYKSLNKFRRIKVVR